jgi:hypothetical protein
MAITKKTPVMHEGLMVKERQTSKVFTYFCSEIGESRDIYRFDIDQNDLKNAVGLFNMFKGARDYFKPEDARCKLVDIDVFYTGAHWSVERWWTRDERVSLGVEDEIESITPEDMGGIVEDLANTLFAYKDQFVGLQKKKSDLGHKTIALTDEKYFTLVTGGIGKNKTQLQAMDTKDISDIPVYTAAKAPIVYIKPLQGKAPIAATAERPIISFATNGDGSAGRNFIVHISSFYLNVDRIAVIVKNPQLLPLYVYTQISDMREKHRFSHSFKANRHNLKIVEILVPISKSGEFDVDVQANIAAQFELVNQLKDDICEKRNQISKVMVDVDLSDYTMVYMPLSMLLTTVKGKGVYTRKYGDEHKGDYPVFSASSATPLTYIDSFDYNGKYLSWSTNGIAGTVTILDGRFSINGDRGLLIPKTEQIDLQYLKYVLEPIFRNLAKGRKGDKGEDEFTKLYPSMIENVDIPLPVDYNGSICLMSQQDIARMYETIEQYRAEILDKLDALVVQKISY